MFKVLLPIDDSEVSMHAVEQLLKLTRWCREPIEAHLLNIQAPLHGEVSRFLSPEQIHEFHRENGLQALAGAREKLDAAGVDYQYHISIGDPAEVIVEYATEKGFDQIIMGTHARGVFAKLLLGSVAAHVIQHTGIPVLLVK